MMRATRRLLSMLSPREAAAGGRCVLQSAGVLAVPSGRHRVWVEFEDGKQAWFHSLWLQDNCGRWRQEGTGQKTRGALQGLGTLPGVADCRTDGDSLVVRWLDNTESRFSAQFLHAHNTAASALSRSEQRRKPSPLMAGDAWPALPFADLMGSDRHVHTFLSHINTAGLCVVKDCPLLQSTVEDIATRIAFPMATLYGTVWDVKAVPNPVNIAYTGVELGLHNDLAYYESPPGLQLLHCLAMDSDVVGGESLFADAFGAAECLRATDPAAFATLCRVPATFQKDHQQRARPARFFYSRPHITTNAFGSVVTVMWAPAFEGPVRAPLEDVEAYYDAYNKFEAILNEPGRVLEGRLAPGDTVVFNQRRVLHGRRAFTATANGTRHLRGCYVNIDEYVNRLRVLELEFGDGEDLDSVKRVGNGDMR